MNNLVGKKAPDFEGIAVVDREFKTIRLSDYNGKYVLVFFWKRNFTALGRAELIAFDERVKDFEEMKFQLIGCSTDSHFSHLAWLKQPTDVGGLGDLKFPIVSDSAHRISRAFGILDDDDGSSHVYVLSLLLFGLASCVYWASFIVDTNGIVRRLAINDSQVGSNVDEILTLASAFQYIDSFKKDEEIENLDCIIELIPGIFVGNEKDAGNEDEKKKRGITDLLDLRRFADVVNAVGPISSFLQQIRKTKGHRVLLFSDDARKTASALIAYFLTISNCNIEDCWHFIKYKLEDLKLVKPEKEDLVTYEQSQWRLQLRQNLDVGFYVNSREYESNRIFGYLIARKHMIEKLKKKLQKKKDQGKKEKK